MINKYGYCNYNFKDFILKRITTNLEIMVVIVKFIICRILMVILPRLFLMIIRENITMYNDTLTYIEKSIKLKEN